MQCRFCGEALAARVVFCPNCGKHVDSDNPEFSSYGYDSNDSSVSYVLSTPIIESSSAAPIQQFIPNQQLYADPQTYAGQQFYQGTPPLSQGNVQQSPNAYQPPSPQPQKRGGLSIAMIVLLVVLALLVGAGGVITYSAIAHRPTQQTQTAPIITTSDPQQLYTQATSGTPALTDPLNSSNPNGWETVNGYGNCTFSGSVLHVSATQAISKQTMAICIASSTSFDNFVYQVRATIVQGNIAGITFRTNMLGSGLYLFGISSSGAYVLASGQTGGFSKGNIKLLTGGTGQAIKTGVNQSNLLTVIARGSTIYLYANQQYLASVNDSTSSVGGIGVLGENTLGGPVDVAFSAIQVWKL